MDNLIIWEKRKRKKRLSGQGGTEFHIFRFFSFAFDKKIGFCNGKGFRVDLLSVEMNRNVFFMFFCQLCQPFLLPGDFNVGEWESFLAGPVINPGQVKMERSYHWER
jgi:hypothetical protein